MPPFVSKLVSKFGQHAHEIAIAFAVDHDKFSVIGVMLAAAAVLIVLAVQVAVASEGVAVPAE